MKLLPNVYWIDSGSVNFYLCLDEDGVTLVDSGMPKKQGLVWDALSELGYGRSDLKRILLTHADIDHAGSAKAIQAETGAVVYASGATAVYLQQGQSPDHLPKLVQWISNAFVRYPALSETVIQTIEDGEELPILGGMKILATPGHTMEHHSFYSPSTGVLFAGDALSTRNGRLQSTPPRITADQTAANQSALRLLNLSPTLIACGHGKPMKNPLQEDIITLTNQLKH